MVLNLNWECSLQIPGDVWLCIHPAVLLQHLQLCLHPKGTRTISTLATIRLKRPPQLLE